MNIETTDELRTYLVRTGRVEATARFTSQVLAGGVSNRTVLVEWDDGRGWVMKQALSKLRVRDDWFADPARVHREALGLKWLGRLLPGDSLPQFLFEDETEHLLAMTAIPQPHENWKARLLAGDVDFDLVRNFGELLGSLHRLSAGNRCELEPIFADRSFFESLRLDPYFRAAGSKNPGAGGFLERLIEESEGQRLSLVHGDFSPKNTLVYRGRLVLLDYEVIHWGDPAFDVGFALTHFLAKANHVGGWEDRFLQAASRFWATYTAQVTGLAGFQDMESRVVRHTLACLLARVDGRSPLEYLSALERERQRQAVLDLMPAPPTDVGVLIDVLGKRWTR